MAIICPQCGAGYDVTLFQFDHEVRCKCGRVLTYPGENLRSGHLQDTTSETDTTDGEPRTDRGEAESDASN